MKFTEQKLSYSRKKYSKKIINSIYLSTDEKGKKKFLFRSLYGNDRLRILSNIDLVSLFDIKNPLGNDESKMFLNDLVLHEFCNIYILLNRDDTKVMYMIQKTILSL